MEWSGEGLELDGVGWSPRSKVTIVIRMTGRVVEMNFV